MLGEKKLPLLTQLAAVVVIVILGCLLVKVAGDLIGDLGIVATTLAMMIILCLIGIVGQLGAIIQFVLLCLLLCCPPQQRPIFQKQLDDYYVHYGLDLKGGSELLYQINPEEIDPSRSVEDVVSETINVISQRIFDRQIEMHPGQKKDGAEKRRVVVREPRIQRQGDNRILIQLPGLETVETEMVKKKIQTLGNLEFRLVASKKIGAAVDEEKERKEYERYSKNAQRMERYQRRLKQKGYKWFLPREEKDKPRLLWIKDGYDFTGKKFRNFYRTTDYSSGRRVVGFELKHEYHGYFGDFTEKYKKEFLAIVFNNRVVEAPEISTRIDGYGIMVGFKPQEIKSLLDVLKSGSLEVQPELLNEQTIGPSLGEDAIRIGITAGIIGLILVMIFMVFYYLGAGIIANIALVMNIIIVFAILVIWGETLTLPGIAGIILTMGMAVDANIIIFERIREEKYKRQEIIKHEKGKDASYDEEYTRQDLQEVISKGYQQAFSTILDANVTTLITALILYFVGSGPVRGFAFTLGWGIAASFFTAILVTRLLFTVLIEGRVFKKIVMLEWIKEPNIQFARNMRLCGIGSLILITIGASLFFYRGEANYGLDLKGGILAHISLQKPLTSEAVRARLKDKFSVEVQHIETAAGEKSKGWYEFSIRLPNLHQEAIDKIKGELTTVANSMRTKKAALKDFSSMLIRAREDDKIAAKNLRELESKNGSKSEIEDVKSEIKRAKNVIRETRSRIRDLEIEVDKLKQRRSELMAEKNRLAGIEELRREIEKRFQSELSPQPFGDLKLGEGRYSLYHVIPVHMRTPVSGKFMMQTLEKNGLFREVHVGSREFQATAKLDKAPVDAQKELTALLKRKLDVISRIQPAAVKVEPLQNNSYRLTLTFAQPMPRYAIDRALEKCEWQSYTLAASQDGKDTLRDFSLFVRLPTEMMVHPLKELQKVIPEKMRAAFSETQFNGETVYFSNPFQQFTQISGLVAKAQKAKAYQAIVLALVLILLYIAFRFPNGFIYGSGAVVALAHDVLIALGAIAVFGMLGVVNVEINLPVIAALLTIVGYSLNDTIVIFDRLRENQRKHEKELWERYPQSRIDREFNLGLNQTLSRTLLTSLTTLIVLVAIFVLNFGKGSVMEGFSFTLIVGVIVGTYSSLFVASSLVLAVEKKGRPE